MGAGVEHEYPGPQRHERAAGECYPRYVPAPLGHRAGSWRSMARCVPYANEEGERCGSKRVSAWAVDDAHARIPESLHVTLRLMRRCQWQLPSAAP